MHALGALTPDEKAAYEEHLQSGCAVCESDSRSLEDVAGQLGLAAEPVAPPASLRDRLLSQISADPAPPEAQRPPAGAEVKAEAILMNAGGLLLSRSANMDWEPAPLPGLFVKTLFADPKRQYTTSLVRMEPGITYPSHRHDDVEEVYLLEGDLLVEGHRMQPGDYCRGEPDSLHSEISTQAGALFLALSSQRDEVIQ